MPSSSSPFISPASVTPSRSLSCHTLSSAQATSATVILPSPFESSVASSANPDAPTPPNISAMSSIRPLPLASSTRNPSSLLSHPVRSANMSPSTSK